MVRTRNARDKYFFVVLIAGIGLVSACSRDGRVLRESGPGQGESIAIVTTVAPTDSDASAVATNLFSVSGTWVDSGSLDPRHTCLGSNVSPALTISNVPAGAQSLAISLSETTRPDQPLWVVANLTPESTVIQEGGLPAGAIVGAAFNGDKIVDGYNGPCITDSEIHEFVLV
ncbi:MAG: hypothetical protein RJB50_494, partial [Actinomycetota bacterium]